MSGIIPEETIEEIKSRTDIADVVSEYVSLKKVGLNYKGLCPFHSEKTPSFTVNGEKQIFHCFGCGTGGNVITFLMKAKGLTFPEALGDLAKRCGIDLERVAGKDASKRDKNSLLKKVNEITSLFYRELLGRSETAMRYLNGRGVSEETIKGFSLGYGGDGWDLLYRHLSQKGVPLNLAEEAGLLISKGSGRYYDRFRERVIFPIHDIHGHIIGFGGRTLANTEPKYLNSPESPIFRKSESLYGLGEAKKYIRDEDRAVIVEGYMDLIALHQAGVKNVVATLGTALTTGHMRLIKRFAENVVAVFDADEAGVKATLRSVKIFQEEGMRGFAYSLPAGHDPDTYVRERGAERFRKDIASARPAVEFVIEHFVGRHGTKGVEDKLRVFNEILPYVEGIPSGIERSHYMGMLAERIGIKEEVVVAEFGKKKTGGGIARPDIRLYGGEDRKGAVESTNSRAEIAIARLILQRPDLREKARETQIINDFEDGIYKELSKKVLGLAPDTNPMDHMISEEERGLCSRLMLEDMEGGDPCKELDDCVKSIRHRKIKLEKARLQKEIQEATRRGDRPELLEALIGRMNDLK